eukprot:scaffold155036_cov23-Tisochrysis_lutea.AAC.3
MPSSPPSQTGLRRRPCCRRRRCRPRREGRPTAHQKAACPRASRALMVAAGMRRLDESPRA